jgi:hypothetical protein
MSKTKHCCKCAKHAQGAQCPSPRAIKPPEALTLLEGAITCCRSAGLQVDAANGDNGTLGLFIPNACTILNENSTRVAFRLGAMPQAAGISTVEVSAQSDSPNIGTHRAAREPSAQG